MQVQPCSLMHAFDALNIFESHTKKMLQGHCLVKAHKEETLFIKLEHVMM